MLGSLHAQEFVTVAASDLYEQATQTQSITVDQDIHLELSVGEGIRLDCEEDTHGISNAVLLFAEDGQAWLVVRDREGYQIEYTSSLFKTSTGMFTQIGGSTIVAIAEWTNAEEQTAGKPLKIKFRLSSDRDYNTKVYRDVCDSNRNYSMRMQNMEPVHAEQLTENQKIEAWARLWSEVKFNFAFFDQVPELDWDAEFQSVLSNVRDTKSVSEFYRVLARSMAKLKDGHTHVWGPGIGVNGDGRLPVWLEYDNQDRLRVSHMVDLKNVPSEDMRNRIRKLNIQRGDIVTQLDGVPVESIVDETFRPFICASTPQSAALVAASRLMSGKVGSSVTLSLETIDGTKKKATLLRARYPIHNPNHKGFEFKEVDKDIFYINLPTFSSDQVVTQFKACLPRISAAKALIFDVRGNGGGNSSHGFAIISHLIEKPILKTTWKTPLYRPAFRAWGRESQWHSGEKDFIASAKDNFNGPVAVIVGPSTFSAAEDFVAVLHAARRATVVGRPTGGSTGQPLLIKLPAGGGARICTKRDSYPDGREFVGIGIQPDVVVNPYETMSDDPELAKAILLLEDKVAQNAN